MTSLPHTDQLGSPSAVNQVPTDPTTSNSSIIVFAEWCLTRATLTMSPYLVLVFPLITAGFFTWLVLRDGWYPRQGNDLIKMLLLIAAWFVFFGGVRYASTAVCWELSHELRDPVRLTGLAPRSLFWCQFLVRWWTIFLSILLLVPLVAFARTLGHVALEHLIAGVSAIAMLAILTAGFAAMASVSPGDAGSTELTAATATFLLMVLYHLLFLLPTTAVWVIGISFRGDFEFANNGQLASLSAEYVLKSIAQSMPITVVYRAIANPGLFNPLVPAFWIHLITGLTCLSLAVRVIENRFRVTTRGDQIPATDPYEQPQRRGASLISIRCSDRPIYWKDTRLVDRTGNMQRLWNVAGIILTAAVIFLSLTMEPVLKLFVGGVALCIFGCLVVFRFDALVAAEFRDRTWTSLMLLPIGPQTILREKLAAAFWSTSSMLFPAGAAVLITTSTNPMIMAMAALVLLPIGAILVGICVLNQLIPKSSIGSAIGALLLVLIPLGVVVWDFFSTAVSFMITIIALLCFAAALFYLVDRKLKRWSET